jgi:aspartyl-tRNA(Asn)/glutamyl-tRNA(Gln) amidotransferase subunit A
MVLAEEDRERGHLLERDPDELTRYVRRSLEAARDLGENDVANAARERDRFRGRIAALFDDYDALVTPTAAVPAFPLGERPRMVDGEPVDGLWGAFPFAAPFIVAGIPAVSLPCGLVEGLPVGVQLLGPPLGEAPLLALAEALEQALAFDASAVVERWNLLEPTAEVPL